jgi:hypothetical protein
MMPPASLEQPPLRRHRALLPAGQLDFQQVVIAVALIVGVVSNPTLLKLAWVAAGALGAIAAGSRGGEGKLTKLNCGAQALSTAGDLSLANFIAVIDSRVSIAFSRPPSSRAMVNARG